VGRPRHFRVILTPTPIQRPSWGCRAVIAALRQDRAKPGEPQGGRPGMTDCDAMYLIYSYLARSNGALFCYGFLTKKGHLGSSGVIWPSQISPTAYHLLPSATICKPPPHLRDAHQRRFPRCAVPDEPNKRYGKLLAG
jgi:hypothetical protein